MQHATRGIMQHATRGIMANTIRVFAMIHTFDLAHTATRIHTRGTPTGVHTVDFLIWRIRHDSYR